MSLNKLRVKSLFLMVSSLMLSSCEAPLKLEKFLSRNVLWTSDDGRIEITCQGFGIEEGRASLKINDKDVVASAYFDDLYDCVTFCVTDEKGRESDVMVLDIESISDDGRFSLKMNYNASDDPFYDDYSTVLSKRPFKEDELDAKYFTNGWVNEEYDLALPDRIYSYSNMTKEGVFKGDGIYFRYLDDCRFTIEYQESSEIFASGSYVTHFDNMDLVFDGDCGEEIFGESINMLWCDGVGEPLPPFEG